MARPPSLAQARRWFADDLRTIGHLLDERVIGAFATVPRERFAGPGPWRILHFADGYWTTPDADPRRLYHNVLIALDEERRLNIGEPLLWARQFDRIGVKDGNRVLQIGMGSGYYTAILAELVGANGRVDGIEIDAPLATAAKRNLAA
jgi:protein-L-isoaspartate(D-aspartate) O-methyltransferase